MMDQEAIRSLPYRRCVGLMLLNAEGLIFAGERIDTPGAWQMPQGGIDAGESPTEAALRELEEETGIAASLVKIEAQNSGWIPYDLPADLVPKLWHGRYRGQEQKWFRLRFLGQDSDINIATKHPEFSRWKWCDQAELMQSIVPFKRATYQQLFQELGVR